jgi:predicted dehydrogenase
MVRIGIVGSGFMARTHVEAYADIDNADVVAVASPSNADEFVAERELEADAYAAATAMFDDADVDAVDICTPTPTHREFVEGAAELGLNTFCEKPLAGSLDDAHAIADAVDETGIRFMVGHVLRFFPAYERIKATVDAGGVGDPGVVRARRLSRFPDWGHGNWYANRSKSGGALVDLAIHDLDYLRWVFGPVDRVFARSDGSREEWTHATLRFESGAVGYVEASWAHPDSVGLASELEIAGTDGLIEYDTTDDEAVTLATDDGKTVSNPVGADGYRRELTAFVEAVERGTDVPVGAAEAIDSLRLARAATESAERGVPVAPEEVDA